ncbi:Lrp/AsnC family transcriptional regulator [Candidatus Micrarchaeota archaeon]|nr:Lrp/AsnC family transcriptional regulator [Candidatus Micrarchaeota archaeon]
MQKLDLLDRRILCELDLNARIPASALAKKLHKSKETVNFRINRLLEGKCLKGFYAVFNTSGLGFYYYKIYFKLNSIHPGKEKEIFEYIAKQRRIAYLASMEGYYDGVFLIMAKSPTDLMAFLHPFMKLYGTCIREREISTFLSTHRFNQKFLYSGGAQADWHYPYEMGNYPLGETDAKILKSISSSARLPIVEIAKQAGIDAKRAQYRLKKLEKGGIILAYTTALDFGKLGLQFVQLNISLNDPTAGRQMLSHFNSTNRCLFAIEMMGRYDLTIELHVENNAQLQRIMAAFKEKFSSKCNECDVSTITKEYVVIWGPF